MFAAGFPRALGANWKEEVSFHHRWIHRVSQSDLFGATWFDKARVCMVVVR